MLASRFIFSFRTMDLQRTRNAGGLMTPILTTKMAKLRYLEHNCWEIGLRNVTIYIDPVMSQLYFGVSLLYRGNKKVVDEAKELLKMASQADVILISQGFDDHAHAPTLRALVTLNQKVKYISPPSALSILTKSGISAADVTLLRPTESTIISKDNFAVKVIATCGALPGPPGGMVENGNILQPCDDFTNVAESCKGPTIYYEPHCMYSPAELSQLHADAVITPVSKQRLFGFTLVDGGQKAIELAKSLGATYIVPMRNGELEQSGVLSKIISKVGTEQDFIVMASKHFQVLPAPPGAEILVSMKPHS